MSLELYAVLLSVIIFIIGLFLIAREMLKTISDQRETINEQREFLCEAEQENRRLLTDIRRVILELEQGASDLVYQAKLERAANAFKKVKR